MAMIDDAASDSNKWKNIVKRLEGCHTLLNAVTGYYIRVKL